MNKVLIFGMILIGSLGFWAGQVEGEPKQEGEIVLIRVRAEAVAETEAIWSVSSLHEQEALKLGTHTGLKDFDALGERYGLLWIKQTYGDRQLYGLYFPSGSPVEEIMAAYAQLPFIEHTQGLYPDIYKDEELVIIQVKDEALQVDEVLFQAAWPVGKITEARQAGPPRTGLADFDSLTARFRLLWIERFWAADFDPIVRNRRTYVLHFPIGSPVEEIMAAYAKLPFIDHTSPGRVPIKLAVEKMTWGSIKYRMNYLTQGGRQ